MNDIEKEYYRRLALQQEYGGTDKPVNKIEPLVSVVTITYQHAPYIRQCLDSILMQETDFPFELIIGEDGSTDGTREICIEYAERHPDKIRLFLRDRNLTQYHTNDGRVIRFNGHFTRAAARGKYIAICEGDDYWIDRAKLNIQYRVLLENKHATGCCTYFSVIDEKNNITSIKNKYQKLRNIKLREMIIANPVGTLTVMYRNLDSLKLLLPEPLLRVWFTDKCLWSMLLFKGPFIEIPKITSVYRNHSGGISKSISIERIEKDAICYAKYLLENTHHKYYVAIKAFLARNYALIGNKYLENMHYAKAIKYFFKSIITKISTKTIRTQIKFLIILFFSIIPNNNINNRWGLLKNK